MIIKCQPTTFFIISIQGQNQPYYVDEYEKTNTQIIFTDNLGMRCEYPLASCIVREAVSRRKVKEQSEKVSNEN